jgi:hypothetical protein
MFPNTPLTDAEAARFNAAGFEVGLHINTGCADFTPASLEANYAQQIAAWTAAFPGIPAPTTQRHHCLAWSDWATGAKVQLRHGMRLDTSYYYWPPSWVNDTPGHMTGSAMPMRFADLDGTMIDVYQAVTQMTDESGQGFPFTIDTLLSRALGPEEHYGAYTVNAHTDVNPSAVSDAVVASALSRGVPVVSSRQMLTWLDGRNSSSFSSIAWSGGALRFTVVPGSGANGLQARVPLHVGFLYPGVEPGGVLRSITRGGTPVTFAIEAANGIEYGSFLAVAGAYVATYAADTTPPTQAASVPDNGATGIGVTKSVTATFSEAVDPATINSTTFELRDASNAVVPATLTYSALSRTATLTSSAPLAPGVTYTATVKGGATDPRVKDLAGNALVANISWSFTTADAASWPWSIWALGASGILLASALYFRLGRPGPKPEPELDPEPVPAAGLAFPVSYPRISSRFLTKAALHQEPEPSPARPQAEHWQGEERNAAPS